jgi:drug/metabolite transporter (DMT)-like permease
MEFTRDQKRSLWLGIGLTTLASILWGSTYPVIQIGLRYYNAYQISLFRALFATAALLSLFISSRRGREQLRLPRDRKAVALLFASSIFGAAGFWVLLNLSVLFLEADTSSFLVALYPLMAIILASLFLEDRITAARAAGVVLGIVGTGVIVALGGRAQLAGPAPLLGSLIALGAAFFWACYMVTTKVLTGMKDVKAGFEYTPGYVTLVTFVLAIVPTLAIVVATGLPPDLAVGAPGLEAVLYLGVVTSAFAFLIFNVGMKIIGVSRAAVNQLLFPAVTIILSYFLLGETVNLADLIGIGMIVFGVAIAQFSG